MHAADAVTNENENTDKKKEGNFSKQLRDKIFKSDSLVNSTRL